MEKCNTEIVVTKCLGDYEPAYEGYVSLELAPDEEPVVVWFACVDGKVTFEEDDLEELVGVHVKGLVETLTPKIQETVAKIPDPLMERELDVPVHKLHKYVGNTIYEWCPHCDKEVELKQEFEPQRCPSCGVIILPCNMCVIDDGCDCNHCPISGTNGHVPENDMKEHSNEK